ncbi:unnamed protein product, partial [Medioppia subpectinata]
STGSANETNNDTKYNIIDNSEDIAVNATKTIEELYEEQQQKVANNTDVLQTTNLTNREGTYDNQRVDTLTTIIPAMPGIPIFRSPPEFKIHDPDEGPLEPYFHPGNTTDENHWYMPSTDTPGQKYVYVKRPDFEAEKGSLEETYKHLLVGANDDDGEDVPLPPDFDDTQQNYTNNGNDTTYDTSSNVTEDVLKDITTVRPNILPKPLPLPAPPIMPPLLPRPHLTQPLPYHNYYMPQNAYYNRYSYGYLPYRVPYYQYMRRFNPLQYYGRNYGYNGNQWPPIVTFPTTTETIATTDVYKMLPKSYEEFGAKIARVTVEEDQQSDPLSAADEDTLEAMGPLELGTTTEQSAKEIQFIINSRLHPKPNNKTRDSVNSKPIDKESQIGSKQKFRPNIMNSYLKPNTQYKTNQYLPHNYDFMDENDDHIVLAEDRQFAPKPMKKRKKIRISLANKKIPRIRDNRRRIYIKSSGKTGAKVGDRRLIRGKHYKIRRIIRKKINQTNRALSHGSIGHAVTKIPTKHNNIDWRSDGNKPDITTKRPKFLFRASIKDESLRVDSRGVKWWSLEQPSYCSQDIYVTKGCAKTEPNKRWSYNPTDKKCYAYEDYCYDLKPNSFKSSKDCFRKCYRIDKI